MQRVANCILRNNDTVLMLKKPKRGWWVAPGGKVEPTETIQEAVIREFKEETNLILINPALKGVFNIIIKEGSKVMDEWMLFTYYATDFSGHLNSFSHEGVNEWKNVKDVIALPKAKGDNVYIRHMLMSKELITGKFFYTPEYELISYSLDHKSAMLIT